MGPVSSDPVLDTAFRSQEAGATDQILRAGFAAVLSCESPRLRIREAYLSWPLRYAIVGPLFHSRNEERLRVYDFPILHTAQRTSLMQKYKNR
jgi:hypothetical protein